MTNEPTLVLRFRDLSTQLGGTIRQHCEMIERHGCVWWGWWKSAHERSLPRETVNSIHRPGPIYLLHSGMPTDPLTLYRATMAETRTSPTALDLPSPDIALTPSYYTEKRCPLWLRLTELSQQPEQEIDKITVVDLPTLPESRSQERWDMRGKTYSSTSALRRTDVTLWLAVVQP